jgi:ribonuclease HI
MYRGPLNEAGWNYWLRNHPDIGLRNTITDVIRFGALIGYTGPPQFILGANLPSALNDPAAITNDVLKRATAGQILKLTTLPDRFIASPLGLAPKPDGTWRRIHHLSSPTGHSVNDHIPQAWGTLTYTRFDDAVAAIQACGPRAVLVKRDLADAFRHIPVHPDNWWLLGFGWLGAWWCDQFLPFGCRTSPAIFDLFASALEWVLQTQLHWQHVLHYLDDFLAVFAAEHAQQAQKFKSDFSQVCSHLGFQLKEEKGEKGLRIRFLGIEIDTEKMEARLPQEKHEKAIALVDSIRERRSVKFKELDAAIGFLSFASKVVPASRPFLRRLYDALAGAPRTHHIRISSHVKKDLTWWRTFLPQWNGVRILSNKSRTIRMWTDASGKKGIGGYFLEAGETPADIRASTQLFSTTVPQRHKDKHINFKEMYAVWHALQNWTLESTASTVELHCDNEAVVAALTKGSIKGPAIGPLRRIAMLLALHDIDLKCAWIPTTENTLADALSRWDTEKIANLCPNLQ